MKKPLVSILVLSLICLLAGCQAKPFSDLSLDVPTMEIKSTSITSSGQLITPCAANKSPNNPKGENLSPQLSWDAVEGATSYAVVMFDEDANWLHWIALDIKSTTLEQGAYTDPADYVGPYPPAGSGAHHYRLEVFALKTATDNLVLKVDSEQSYSEIVRYMNRSGNGENNILARGHIICSFENT